MTKIAKISPKVIIDNFSIKSSGIEAYTLVDGEDIDFHINQKDFEQFVDRHELREWNNDSYSYYSECMMEDNGTTPWEDVYASYEKMTEFLRLYIIDCYDQSAWDIGTPLKNILSSF